MPNLLKANSLEELPDDVPPTIGTRPVPLSAENARRKKAKNDTDLEAWELAHTGFENHTMSSMSTPYR